VTRGVDTSVCLKKGKTDSALEHLFWLKSVKIVIIRTNTIEQLARYTGSLLSSSFKKILS